MAQVIRFQCVAETHREAAGILSERGVTIHHGNLAYCETVDPDTPHQWVATGGISLQSLMHRLSSSRRTEDGSAPRQGPITRTRS
jgi:hypothetical protein